MIHKDENSCQQSKHRRQEHIHPPGVGQQVFRKQQGMGYQPAALLPRGLELAGYIQFGGGNAREIVQGGHWYNANDDRKVREEVARGAW